MRRLLVTYLLLLLLLTITVAASFVELGDLGIVVTLTISSAKTLLIVLFFMQLYQGSALLRTAAAVGVIWLLLLFALSLVDYGARFPQTISYQLTQTK